MMGSQKRNGRRSGDRKGDGATKPTYRRVAIECGCRDTRLDVLMIHRQGGGLVHETRIYAIDKRSDLRCSHCGTTHDVEKEGIPIPVSGLPTTIAAEINRLRRAVGLPDFLFRLKVDGPQDPTPRQELLEAIAPLGDLRRYSSVVAVR